MPGASRDIYARPEAERRQHQQVIDLKARLPEAWAELFSTCYPRLLKYAYIRVGSTAEAEDLTSTVFVRALNAIDSYKQNDRPIIAWLYGITQNLIREHLRARARNGNPMTGTLDTSELAREPEGDVALAVSSSLDLQAAFTHLSHAQQEVVALVHLGGFKVKEVAAMLGKSERSIYYLEARGLIRLREALQAKDEGKSRG